MNKQKQEADERKRQGIGQRWKNDGGMCFLCDNVGQAIDAQGNPKIADNLIYDRVDYLILPNKYPSFIGHSLLIPKEHDDETRRVKPIDGEYKPEAGKTRGAIFTPEYLEVMVSASIDFGLVGTSNHVLNGMSIPRHKHFHVFPEDLDLFNIEHILGRKTEIADRVYKSDATPFDILILCYGHSDKLIERASVLLKNMEEDNQVFNLFYKSRLGVGYLFVSSLKNGAAITRNVAVGGGISFNAVDKIDEGYLKKVMENVPLKGEYDWGRYL